MSILPQDHAAAIISHYLRILTRRAGLRWTDANDDDMALLASLLGGDEPERDEMPPYERPIVSDRKTIVLDDVERRQWGDFRRWQAERDDDDARRMLRREGGAR